MRLRILKKQVWGKMMSFMLTWIKDIKFIGFSVDYLLKPCTVTAEGPVSIPGQGTKIPCAAWSSQNKKKKKEEEEPSDEHR